MKHPFLQKLSTIVNHVIEELDALTDPQPTETDLPTSDDRSIIHVVIPKGIPHVSNQQLQLTVSATAGGTFVRTYYEGPQELDESTSSLTLKRAINDYLSSRL